MTEVDWTPNRRITSAEDMFQELFDTDEVDLGARGVVLVRSLSRAEVHRCGKVKTPEEAERLTLHYGLVEPKLTVEQVARWQEACNAREITRVVAAIGRLSGMDERAEKDAYKSPSDEPDA